jgi:hypothetical protein
MKQLFKLSALIVLGLLIQTAYAQNSGIVGCQGGVCTGPSWDPDWQISRGVRPPQGQQQYTSPTPPPPPVKWEDRWGAIVLGMHPNADGIVGKSSKMTSKSAAKTAAMTDCKSQGGGETCGSNIGDVYIYHNSCVAFAVGPAYGGSMAADYPPEKAKQRAIEGCIKDTGKNCEVIYSDCSMAAQIQ